jgi:predicted molibdopterin-dependent oxidoreductase YjgC
MPEVLQAPDVSHITGEYIETAIIQIQIERKFTMPELEINHQVVSFEKGQTILEAAEKNNINIPTLCYLADASPTGRCRICLVQIEGSDRLLTACDTPAGEGMKILTESPAVKAARKTNIEMLVASGTHNCLIMDQSQDNWTRSQLMIMEQPWHNIMCPSYGDCRLQELAIEYGVRADDLEMQYEGHPLDDETPMIVRDFSRCIGCGRCIQACNEIQVNGAIPEPYGSRKDHSKGWYPLVDYDHCTHCGQCVQVCPTGALFEKKAFGWAAANETKKVRTTCPYCGVGCQLWLHMDNDRIKKVTAVENGAPNMGRLCVKGRFGYDFIYSEERLKTPLIKEGDGFREASWDEALDLVANKFKEIIAKHGPDALAGVSCARSINEDSYQMQKLFRAVFKTNNIDHCART